MRKLFVKKYQNSLYPYWETVVSDSELCRKEYEDFKDAECFVPESELKYLEKKLDIAKRALEFYANVSTTVQTEDHLFIRESDGDFFKIEEKALDALSKIGEVK